MKEIYQFVVKDEDRNDVSLENYQGYVLLIMNSATECGFTDQYDELQPLYERYENRKFVILDFPCNQFGEQAPGTTKEIIKYCDMEYAITFPILDKVDVNGKNAAPLFQYLKKQKGFQGFDTQHPLTSILDERLKREDPLYKQNDDIKWNFTKFLVDREGTVVARFEPTTPISVIEKAIQEIL